MPTNVLNCPFCKIIDKNDPKVYEIFRDEHVVAFFPIEPATLGHVLVIPRRHVVNVWGLTIEEAEQLSYATLHLSSVIRNTLFPHGLNIVQSNGETATQSVPHLHIHLVPRWKNDSMKIIWPETNFSDSDKLETFQKLHNTANRDNNTALSLTPEDRRKHLDYIQAIVTRQSTASTSAKGWLLPIMTATFSFAFSQKSWELGVIGLVAVFLFAYLDANYLKSEKRFRTLYDTVARSQHMVPSFTLDPADAEAIHDSEELKKSAWKNFINSYIPEWKIWTSWSILPFYFPLIILGICVIMTVLNTK